MLEGCIISFLFSMMSWSAAKIKIKGDNFLLISHSYFRFEFRGSTRDYHESKILFWFSFHK